MKKYYITKQGGLALLINSMIPLVITIYVLIFKKNILLGVSIIGILLFIPCFVISLQNLTEKIVFYEDYFVYKKNLFCKEVKISYNKIDKIIIDFATGYASSGWKPATNPGKRIYFEIQRKIAFHCELTYNFIEEILKRFKKSQIKVLTNIDENIFNFNFPKKYHKLVFSYLTTNSKKKFIKKYGELD